MKIGITCGGIGPYAGGDFASFGAGRGAVGLCTLLGSCRQDHRLAGECKGRGVTGQVVDGSGDGKVVALADRNPGRGYLSGKSKTALITGAAGGIGRATCERLRRSGWNVLAVDCNASKLAWTNDAKIASVVADITSEEENGRMVREAEALFGRLDAVVLNAGITGGGSIDQMPFEAFRQVISVNLFGAVLGIRAALPALRRQGGGSFVLTSSTMGLAGDAQNWAYGASKHALIGLVRSLPREIGWEGIRINALCPGPTQDTGMTGTINEVAPIHYELLQRAVPLQRWADPDEMASVIEFPISPAASYVNGHTMVADGGTITGTGLLPPASGTDRVIPSEVKN